MIIYGKFKVLYCRTQTIICPQISLITQKKKVSAKSATSAGQSIHASVGKQKSDFVKAAYLFYLILYKDLKMETTTAAPVSFTVSAKEEIKRLMAETGFDASQSLRVGVKGGGCSGMTYVLGFDAKTEKDESFEIDGIPVVMEKAHGIYLMGMEVDWQGGLNSRGFTFNNPNASKTCGCGTSFAV